MARSRSWARRIVCVAVSSALSGCAHGPATSPEGVVEAFARDVREGRYERAYGRLSARVRGEMSLEDFVARIESDEAEARAMAARLERTAGPATRLPPRPHPPATRERAVPPRSVRGQHRR